MTALSRHLLLATVLCAGAIQGHAVAAQFVASSTYEIQAAGAASQSGSQGGAAAPGAIHSIDVGDTFAQGTLSSDVRFQGWSSASYGHLKVYATGSAMLSAQAANQSSYLNGAFTSAVSDSFIIRCASCTPGTLGSLAFSINDTATTSRDAHLGQPVGETGLSMANTHWSTSVSLSADGVPTPIPNPPDGPGPPNPGQIMKTHYRLDMLVNGETRVEDVTRYFPPVSGSDLQIQFVFGEPIHLDMSLTGSVIGAVDSGQFTTPVSGDVSMMTDASQSFYWNGITSVRNAEGQLVSSFTALNDVGIDYAGSLAATVVPEPGTWALMGAGLGLLAWLARRRAQPTARGNG